MVADERFDSFTSHCGAFGNQLSDVGQTGGASRTFHWLMADGPLDRVVKLADTRRSERRAARREGSTPSLVTSERRFRLSLISSIRLVRLQGSLLEALSC